MLVEPARLRVRALSILVLVCAALGIAPARAAADTGTIQTNAITRAVSAQGNLRFQTSGYISPNVGQTITGPYVSVTLPTAVTFSSGTVNGSPTVGGQPACTAVGRIVTCRLGDAATSRSYTLDVIGASTPISPLPITYTATVAAGATSAISSYGSATQTVTLAAPGTVGLALTDTYVYSSGTMLPGNVATVGFDVASYGPSAAHNVVVTAELPTSLTWLSAGGSPCTHANRIVTCTLGTLSELDSMYESFSVTAGAPDVDAVRFEVSSTETDWEDDDNAASATYTIEDASNADLGAFMHSTTKRQGRDDVRQTGYVVNYGPGVATGVQLTITYPAGSTPIGLPTLAGGTCTTPAGGTSICTIASLSSLPADLLYRYDATGTATDTGIDRISVLGATTDPDPSNNVASRTTTYVTPGSTDRRVNVTNAYGVRTVFETGTNYSRTYAVENLGPSDSAPTTLTFATGGTVVNIASVTTPAGITCPAPSASTVTCTVAAMAASAPAVNVVVNYTAATIGTTYLTAAFAPDANDPVTSNNLESISARTVVVGSVNLVTYGSDSSPGIGETDTEVVETLYLSNAGPAVAPAGSLLTYETTPERTVIDASVPGGTCTITLAGTHVDCTLGAIAIDGSVDVTLTFMGGPIQAFGEASWSVQPVAGVNDWSPDNNSYDYAAFEVATKGTVDLAPSVAVHEADGEDDVYGSFETGSQLVAEAWVSKDATINPAVDTQLAFELPLGSHYTGLVDGPGGTTCDDVDTIVTCDLGDLSSSASVIIGFDAPTAVVADAVVSVQASTTTTDRRPINDSRTSYSFDIRLGGTVDYYANFFFDVWGSAESGSTVTVIGEVTNETWGTPMLGAAAVFHLPTGTTFVRRTDVTGAACTVAGSIVTCPLGDIPGSGFEAATIEVAIGADVRGDITFGWAVETTSPVDQTSINAPSSILEITPGDAVDGYVLASDASDEHIAGTPVVIALEVDRQLIGTMATTTPSTVTTTLPMSFTAADPILDDTMSDLDVTCSSVGQVVTCTFPTGYGYAALRLLPSAGGDFPLEFTTSGGGTDIDPTNDTDTVDLTIDPPLGTPDQCDNIPGVQGSVPNGMVQTGTECETPPAPVVDLCSNIAGDQEVVPAGMTETAGECATPPPAPAPPAPTPTPPTPVPPAPPVDLCPNIPGAQATVPAGMAYDSVGRCVKPSVYNDVLVATDAGERIDGGGGNDKITGGTGADVLFGGLGIDTIIGGKGTDTIDGGAGNDKLDGGLGNDKMLGGTGNDKILGGGGNDVLDGGTGKDTYSAGSGNDLIKAKDGVAGEAIACGSGKDTVVADKGDKPGVDCENVRLA